MTGVFVKDVAVTSYQRTGASSQGDSPLLRVRLVTPRWRTVELSKLASNGGVGSVGGGGVLRCRQPGLKKPGGDLERIRTRPGGGDEDVRRVRPGQASVTEVRSVTFPSLSVQRSCRFINWPRL